MSLLNPFEGKINSAKNFIKNPFENEVSSAGFDAPDFPEGFIILEILPNGEEGDKVVLQNNWMPKIPFTFGGTTRMKKEYYSGYSEPSVHVFGPEENDITINGLFKDKRFRDLSMKGVSEEIQKQIDSIRIRGNLVKIQLGEFRRYAILKDTKFNLERTSKIEYEITFSIIGFNAPKNAKFLQRRKEVPVDINREILSKAAAFNATASNIPLTVAASLADQINSVINEVASTIATVTDFVDSIFSTIGDIKNSVNRAKGLIKYSQQKLNSFKRQVGSINSFDPSITIGARYASAKYVSSNITSASSLSSLLEQLRIRISNLINDLPLARTLVVQGDNLQKIAIKFYGSSNDWKKIYDYNDLTSTDLVPGTLLEIPRI